MSCLINLRASAQLPENAALADDDDVAAVTTESTADPTADPTSDSAVPTIGAGLLLRLEGL